MPAITMRTKEAIVVEGRYDAMRLKELVESPVLVTDGFDIYKNASKKNLIREYAKTCGIVILTDSDHAGFRIRRYLKGILPKDAVVKHAYIPEIEGKERRKDKPGKDGLLGVEAMSPKVLEEALRKAGCVIENELEPEVKKEQVTRADLYEDGLLGRPESAMRRQEILKRMKLPSKLSVNALLDAINTLWGKETYLEMVQKTSKNGKGG